jgi:hypothetical protein
VAAHLAEAAAVQGRFWPLHELLFGNQKALEGLDLWAYADQLGLDRVRLGVDLDSHGVWQWVYADIDSALESGARRHPDPVRQRTAARWRLRRGDPGPSLGRRNQERMTMAICIDLNQVTLALVAATRGRKCD